MLHPDIAVVRPFHPAQLKNDADALRELLADDVVWSVSSEEVGTRARIEASFV